MSCLSYSLICDRYDYDGYSDNVAGQRVHTLDPKDPVLLGFLGPGGGGSGVSDMGADSSQIILASQNCQLSCLKE